MLNHQLNSCARVFEKFVNLNFFLSLSLSLFLLGIGWNTESCWSVPVFQKYRIGEALISIEMFYDCYFIFCYFSITWKNTFTLPWCWKNSCLFLLLSCTNFHKLKDQIIPGMDLEISRDGQIIFIIFCVFIPIYNVNLFIV